MTEQTQPEALRLADLLDTQVSRFGETRRGSKALAAAELRRLHAENEQLKSLLAQRERPALSDEQIEALPIWANFVGLFPEARKEIVRSIEASPRHRSTDMTQGQSREAFETWAKAIWTATEDWEQAIGCRPGVYNSYELNAAWAAWQAAINHKAADVVLPESSQC